MFSFRKYFRKISVRQFLTEKKKINYVHVNVNVKSHRNGLELESVGRPAKALPK